MAVATGGAFGTAHAEQAFSPAWFAARGAAQSTATATGRLPNGMPSSALTSPSEQQRLANAQLQQSVANLGAAAQALAAQQAIQAAARQAAQTDASVPDGLTQGGLKVDTNSLTQGWINANAPTQTVADGRTTVNVRQTADKAILNWETFNVGKNTTLNFAQQKDWAALNRVNDPQARPSQIQGRIQGDGTVMIVNRNGIVFTGTSQVDTRNLVAAAANISNDQFQKQGIYGVNAATPSFTDALGKVEVRAGARIATREPTSVTQGGGYVLLMGSTVENAGEIVTHRGQTQLAAGDAFIIRRGVGTDGNAESTTRGNEIAPQFAVSSTAGAVINRGLIVAREGDVTLGGRDVRQLGVALSSTTVNNRGTIHLLNSTKDGNGRVTFGQGATTAVLVEDDGSRALDSQRDALIQASRDQDGKRGLTMDAFDNLSRLSDRRDQSRIEVTSGGDVLFDSDSLTLATGGQIAVSAARRGFVANRARLDVSGAVGVSLSMDSNNVKVNVQGNEQRDAPRNRDTGDLLNANVWIDRRRLVYVPAGIGGYTSERWYTSNGLLEVGGYLGNQGHGIGEWAAQGGTVVLGGAEVVTQAGSAVNLAGGTLDVQTGYLNQTWLKGSDGGLYNINTAPSDMQFKGVYRGFESEHARWGKNTTETFYTPLIGPQRVLENGYTVGRDAGQLLVNAPTAILEGDITATVFNGARQTSAASAALSDGYKQSQYAVAREARLALGQYGALGRVGAFQSDVVIGNFVNVASTLGLSDALDAARRNTTWLDASRLSALRLGGLDIATRGNVTLDASLALADGGIVTVVSPVTNLNADITVRGGQVNVGNTLVTSGTEFLLSGGERSAITLAPGKTIDVRGLWTNARMDASTPARLAHTDGGAVKLGSTLDVTLGKGSLIDVSSGAALLANGKVRAGKGGSVTLSADDGGNGTGTLILDGDIRGFGASGGGTLTIGTGQPVVLSQTAILPDGRLAAGQAAPVDLQLGSDFVVPAGSALPFSYTTTLTRLAAGAVVKAGDEPVTLNPTLSSPLIPQAGWIVPSSMTEVVVDGTRSVWPGQTVPAGSRITSVNGPLPDGYVIPAAAFPNGVPIKANVTSYTAGTRVSADFVIEAGTAVPAGAVLDREIAVRPVFTLAPSRFAQGFGNYVVNGHTALAVTKGARIDVTMPVLRLDVNANRIATSDNPEGAWSLWMPPQYLVDAARGTATRRGGADIALQSSGTGGSGHIDIGEGASITVDAGRRIGVESRGQINIDGALHSPGGTIDVVQLTNAYLAKTPATASPGQRSILIGDHAVLDVAGRAPAATDDAYRRLSETPDGGSITIGAPTNRDNPATLAQAAESFIVVRPGALLDASGGSASVDLPGNAGTLTLSGNGGSIAFNSFNGLYFDGTMRAAAGGFGALGGTLILTLETPRYREAVIPDDVRNLRMLVIGQKAMPSGSDKPLTIGTARIGVDQIKAGGFDSVSAYADLIRFDGNVDLALGRRLELYQGTLLSNAPDQTVRLAAPFVQFRPVAYLQLEGNSVYPKATGAFGTQPSDLPTKADLRVDADMIELGSLGLFGVKGALPLASGTRAFNFAGFDTATLRSTGDIRVTSGVGGSRTLDLIAAQIYPVTGVSNKALAPSFIRAAERVRFGRSTDTVPDMPQAAFGRLNVFAKTIEQGGVLRAPLGMIALGSPIESGSGTTYVGPTESVVLLPGSVTSASANGLLLPYGGTVDGLTYSHAGNTLTGSLDLTTGVTFGGKSFDVRKGAVIDLSGGGELLGAGFVSGRGGSVDILTTPLANAGPGFSYSSASNKVYAIVPGAQPNYAPNDPEAGAMPDLGRQITVPDGVPGLKAGTYTLMPARYALLPGAYRVELGARTTATSRPVLTRDGSWLVQGYRGQALTSYRDVLPTRLIVTSGQTVRSHSQYNETGLADFLVASAARSGAPRPVLPADARTLFLTYDTTPGKLPALAFQGEALFTPGRNGQGGIVSIDGTGARALKLEIAPSGATPTPGYVSLGDTDLNAIGADRLILGGGMVASDKLTIDGMTHTLAVREGAQLRAPEIFLVGGAGGITIDDAASISTVDMGRTTPFPTSAGYRYSVARDAFFQINALVLSNNLVDIVSQAGNGAGAGMNIGKAELYTEGTLAFTASRAGTLVLSPDLRFGARYLSFAVPNINFGEASALDAAARAGVLPQGLILNQQVLGNLFKGNASPGVPRVESLILSAGNAINVFGPVSFDTIDPSTGKSSLAELVLNTPAIYGLGGSGDTARITTGRLVWNGVSDGRTPGPNVEPISLPPPGVLPGGAGTGRGTLDIAANEIVFGYPKYGLPDTQLTLDRLLLGFSTVNLLASERITANNRNTLAVYQSGTNAATYAGGNLNLVTPLMTGEAASINRIAAGGALRLSSPTAGTPANASEALGAEIGLKGQTVTLASAIRLPSGKLTVAADGDVRLEDAARIDVAGRELKFFDVSKYSWGGDVDLSSAHGNVTQASGAVIDLSALRNRAGSLSVTAIDASAGTVSLAGTILGAATGTYDAGGTRVPYLDASLDVRSQSIDDFVGLNRRLSDGGVFGARRYQLQREGLALVVGDELKANTIDVSVDAGTLTVNGRVDASGPQVGTIRLAARDDLTLASTAVLDAHGTQLRVDNRGQVIDAPNRATVELSAGRNLTTGVPGWLRLQPGATIDVRSADGATRGAIELNAQRLDMRGGDIAIDASGPIAINGAKRVAVNGFWRYTDAPLGTPSSDGRPTQVIKQDYLDRIDGDSRAFVNAAWANRDLQGRLAGLRSLGDVYHLRPGVEIASATPSGNLLVDGDLDFSGYRYGPRADASVRGSGEPGVLLLRAGGDLTIKGSINDGFAPPPATPDDNGWMINGKVHAGDILTAPYDGTGRTTVFENDYLLPDDCWDCMVISPAGDFYINGMTVPAGTQAEVIYLPAGMPSPMTYDVSVPRPEPGKIWAVAPMLAPGTRSWSMQLAAGADVGSVNSHSLQTTKRGDLVLDDEHFSGPDRTFRAISVVRTGTGDLSLLAGGNLTMKSLFGVYTAGTQSSPVLAADGSNPYNLPRGVEQQSGSGATTVLGPNGTAYESLVNGPSSVYQAWFPEQGGNVLLKAQGNITGFTAGTAAATATAGTGNWLWRQGGDVGGVPAAWWINFGSYALPTTNDGTRPSQIPRLVGFSGIGALGGGNVDIRVGGDAGVVAAMGDSTERISQGLNVAVGGTGRVTADGNWIVTGGGDLNVRIGGSLNPLDPNMTRSSSNESLFVRGAVLDANLTGTLTNLRGALSLSAGAIGRIDLGYGVKSLAYTADPRAVDLDTPNGGRSNGGPTLVLGDSAVSFASRGDLVLSRVDDPGRALVHNTTPYRVTSEGSSVDYRGGGYSWFSLWNDRTSVDLLAAGGNLTPTTVGTTDGQSRSVGDYPAILRAAAGGGGIYYGARLYDGANVYTTSVTLAPSAAGQLEILARKSIQAMGLSLNMSGADTSVVATPAHPAFIGYAGQNARTVSNMATFLPVGAGAGSLYAFGSNTITGDLHAGDADPQRFYAVEGDIVGLRTGEVLDFTNGGTMASRYPYNQWNVAAKPVWVIAGRDVVGAGAVPAFYVNGKPIYADGAYSAKSSGNLLYHPDATDVSVVRAGRDILQSNFLVAGPGALEISAGRHLYQADLGSITSVGPIATGDSRPGATIVAMAGVGAGGPDYAGLRRYLAPANLLAVDAPLGAMGKVAKTYEGELAAWLKSRYGFSGSSAEALAYFDTLTADARSIFLRSVFYAELKAGGREYNDVDSRRHGSYLRGRNAIAALFPETADSAARAGDITMFGGAGIRTYFGGDIDMLAPSGKIIAGVPGVVPPATSGIVTQGAGDINLYSRSSVLLGLSRIMTTFGGSILAWSAQGDINAGRGAKTTVLYTPPKLTYDDKGNVTLASQVPSTGAGIATLAPIAEVPAGDVDLIAPLGTIDAGEAGIRVSGNANVAALHVVNAENIQVQGKSTGMPTVAAVNVGALANASTTASQAASASQDAVARDRAAARQSRPSIFNVRMLGTGGDASAPAAGDLRRALPAGAASTPSQTPYDARIPVQVLGHGKQFDPALMSMLSDDERRQLRQER
ncbi:filamentous haemagglutinin family protein [Pandoraea pulmonicola]|uniref:filamentous haemagglutinin family protein n=1 Tax=Pandoraea pulmonicola TaxID=93221 RepID=UPI00135BF9E0|nr:filamentous haemagglutinin family protein [Pandoraea pulmonicola]